MLILDVLDNRIPAICQEQVDRASIPSIIVDLIAVSRCIDNIET
jgi:hypothetical protein